MTHISELMTRMNPWWSGEFKEEFKPRKVYNRINELLKVRQIIALTGLRRVGKTTLMMKVVNDYLANGFSPGNILYFSFDESQNSSIIDIISEYERMFNKSLRGGECLLLFDEIQKLKEWENKLKTIYDTYKSGVKIIISGSESLFIKKRMEENLAGRIFEVRVEQLTFPEYLGFIGQEVEPYEVHKGRLLAAMSSFSRTQGFPELAESDSMPNIKNYIDSIINTVLYKDIPSIFPVENPGILESIMRILMEEPGQIIDFSKLSRDLKISRHTASNYVGYLEASFLIRKLYNYSGSARKMERSLRKYYPAVISPELTFKEDAYHRSRVFEWLVVNQLKQGFFWSDSYKHEVDMVLKGKALIPLEIKYGKIETGSVEAFLSRFNERKGYVISSSEKGTMKYGGSVIKIIPAPMLFVDAGKILGDVEVDL